MRGNITLRETDDRLYFGNGRMTLCFDRASGNWLSLESELLALSPSGLPDCLLRLGGKSGSSLHEGLNVNWASQVFTGTHIEGADIRLTGHCLRQTQDAVELILRGEVGDFLLDRIYSLTDEGLLIRRFEATYRGETTEFVRGAVYYTPAFSGLTFAEYPGSVIPGENDLRRGAAPSVCVSPSSRASARPFSSFLTANVTRPPRARNSYPATRAAPPPPRISAWTPCVRTPPFSSAESMPRPSVM